MTDFLLEIGNIRSGLINVWNGDFDPNLSRIERFNDQFKFDRLYINKPTVIKTSDGVFEYVWTDVWMTGLYNYRNFRRGRTSVSGYFFIRGEVLTPVTQSYALQYLIDLEILRENRFGF